MLFLVVALPLVTLPVGGAPATPEIPTAIRYLPGGEVIADLPSYHCRRTDGPIRVDGRLSEPIWTRIAPTRRFRGWDGKRMPGAKTRMKACWSASHLYLAFSCEDGDAFSPYRRRDEPLYEAEVVEAFLAPTSDPSRYLEFEVSPAGVLFDARVVNVRPVGQARRGPMSVDTAWNAAGVRAAVHVDGTLNRRGDRDRAWTVELAIPFADLDLARPPRAGDAWRANFYRINRNGADEYSAWSATLTPQPDFHVPARFGKLVFGG
jgi:hypothetical protein